MIGGAPLRATVAARGCNDSTLAARRSDDETPGLDRDEHGASACPGFAGGSGGPAVADGPDAV